MPKVTGFNRKRVGHRNNFAHISSPPANKDAYGNVDYKDGTWETIVEDWPCELIDVSGGEIIYGFATNTRTEKVAIGDAPAINGRVTTKERVVIDGKTYGIVAVRDVSGDRRTLRLEIRSQK